MDAQAKYQATLRAAQLVFPGFRIRYKDEVWHQRVLNKLMFFTNSTGGYNSYTTTWGRTVYFGSKEYVETHAPWRTLQHELVHTWDFMTFYGLLPRWLWPVNYILFALCYLFPAPLPLPAPGRMWAELRAYRRSRELHPNADPVEKATHYASSFTGPAYWFMWPFRQWIIQKLATGESPYKDAMDSWIADATEEPTEV